MVIAKGVDFTAELHELIELDGFFAEADDEGFRADTLRRVQNAAFTQIVIVRFASRYSLILDIVNRVVGQRKIFLADRAFDTCVPHLLV